MKNIIQKCAVFMMVGIVVMLVGCSNKPADISDETYRIGKMAVETVDQYIDAAIAAEEAESKLERYDDLLDRESENEELSELESIKASRLALSCLLISHDIGRNDISGGRLDDIIKERNSMAEVLEIEER